MGELKVEVVPRGDVLTSYSTVADSDLTVGMFAGDMQRFNEADVVIVKNEADGRLTVLHSKVPLEELIARIRG